MSMDCAPALTERCTWVQRGVGLNETHTSAASRRGAFWRRVPTSATPRAIPVSTYVCATTKKDNVSERVAKNAGSTCVCQDNLFS